MSAVLLIASLGTATPAQAAAEAPAPSGSTESPAPAKLAAPKIWSTAASALPLDDVAGRTEKQNNASIVTQLAPGHISTHPVLTVVQGPGAVSASNYTLKADIPEFQPMDVSGFIDGLPGAGSYGTAKWTMYGPVINPDMTFFSASASSPVFESGTINMQNGAFSFATHRAPVIAESDFLKNTTIDTSVDSSGNLAWSTSHFSQHYYLVMEWAGTDTISGLDPVFPSFIGSESFSIRPQTIVRVPAGIPAKRPALVPSPVAVVPAPVVPEPEIPAPVVPIAEAPAPVPPKPQPLINSSVSPKPNNPAALPSEGGLLLLASGVVVAALALKRKKGSVSRPS